ncbi:MAG: glycoside-hydrolase family protein [Cyanobacteria bacterium RYN_339]|nr:glycoside-hydrolase family protein [Cyanobacteria bacterium RYN_339]
MYRRLLPLLIATSCAPVQPPAASLGVPLTATPLTATPLPARAVASPQARAKVVDALRLAERVGLLALAVRNDRVLRQPVASARLLAAARTPQSQLAWRYEDAEHVVDAKAGASVVPPGPAGTPAVQELALTITRDAGGRTGAVTARNELAGATVVAGELVFQPDAQATATGDDVKFTDAGAPLRITLAPRGGSGAGTYLEARANEAADGSLVVTATSAGTEVAVTFRADGRHALRCWGAGFGAMVADVDPAGRGVGTLFDGVPEPGKSAPIGELSLLDAGGGSLRFYGPDLAAEGATPFAFTGGGPAPAQPTPAAAAEPGLGVGRGIPAGGPWLAYYGGATELAARFGSLEAAAARYRLFIIEADPATGNFTADQITTLKRGGANRVLSYLNAGSVEQGRSYWNAVDRAGYVPAKDLADAQLGPYAGFADEVWMDPTNLAWRHLLLGYAAPKLVAGADQGGRGADGLFLDNMELAEHSDANGPEADNGPCSAACRVATYDIVRELRARYPNLLIVANGATGEASRTTAFGGTSYASMLDGLVRESAFGAGTDEAGRAELARWRELGLWAGGRPFWIGTIDYVGACDASVAADALAVVKASTAEGYAPFVSSSTNHLAGLCTW